MKVLDYLLPEGDLFRSVDYAGCEEVDTGHKRVELPMAVLVNEDSYSRGGVFAAALQEYEWATIVGSQTYGKGNFQTAFYLSDGSMVNLSIGKYYTPGGKSLMETGVTPDVVVDLDDEQYALLYYNAPRTGRRSAISGRNRHIDIENLLTDRARCGYNGNWRFRNILPRFSGDDDRKDRELWQKNSKSARSASKGAGAGTALSEDDARKAKSPSRSKRPVRSATSRKTANMTRRKTSRPSSMAASPR